MDSGLYSIPEKMADKRCRTCIYIFSEGDIWNGRPAKEADRLTFTCDENTPDREFHSPDGCEAFLLELVVDRTPRFYYNTGV